MPEWEFIDDVSPEVSPSLPKTKKVPYYSLNKKQQDINDLIKKPSPKYSESSDIDRHLARTGARIGESVAGTPGNLLDLGLGVGNYLTGGAIPKYSQVQENLPISLPTSSQVKEFTKKLSGGYTEPHTKNEEFYDNVISDLTSLLLPGGLKNPKSLLNAANLVRTGSTALGGNLAAKAAENLGFGKGGQAAANIGTTIAIGLLGGKQQLSSRMAQSFDAAEKAAEGQFHNAGKLRESIGNTLRNLHPRDFKDKQFILDRIESIYSWLGNKATASVSQGVQRVKDLNDYFRNQNLTSIGKRELRKVTQPVIDFLQDYADTGTKAAKEFGKHQNEAIDIFKGFNNASKIGAFLNKHVRVDSLKNPLVKSLLYASPWFHKVPHALGALGTAVGVKEAFKLMDLISNSKQAAKAFKDIGIGALNQSASQVNKGMKLFEKSVGDYGFLPEGAEWID